jgi:hypothetical protein
LELSERPKTPIAISIAAIPLAAYPGTSSTGVHASTRTGRINYDPNQNTPVPPIVSSTSRTTLPAISFTLSHNLDEQQQQQQQQYPHLHFILLLLFDTSHPLWRIASSQISTKGDDVILTLNANSTIPPLEVIKTVKRLEPWINP